MGEGKERGPCARERNGWCPIAAGRCADGKGLHCTQWKSDKKRIAALRRWAAARRGEGRIGKGKSCGEY